MFYLALFQSVLLFWAETWVLSEAISRKPEGVCVGFLRWITRQGEVRQKDRTCRQVSEEKVLEKAGTQTPCTYIGKSQAIVAVRVALCPILEVCDRETGYKGVGRRWGPGWRQTTAIKQLIDTLKDILAAERERRWKSGRCGKSGGGDRDTEESEYGAGSDGSRDAGTETGDTQVGELSCVDA